MGDNLKQHADDVCRCGHTRRLHVAGRCGAADDVFECDCEQFDGLEEA